MWNRIIRAIRNKLGITALEHDALQLLGEHDRLAKRTKTLEKDTTIHSIDARLADLEHRWASLGTQAQNAMERAVTLNRTGKQILEHFNLAVDANMYGDSWAVFVVGNPKQPRVYFIDLRGVTAKDIEELVTRYNGVRQAVDTPYGMPSIKPLRRL